MSTHPVAYPAPLAPVIPIGRPDPVRARVTVNPQLTNDQIHEAEGHKTIHILPETRSGGPRRPHPGDIIYWIACVCGACLLLIFATT